MEDALTRKLLAEEEDRRLHPEDYRLPLRCPVCGRSAWHQFPKAEVLAYRKRHGGNPLEAFCQKCEEKEEKDAQENDPQQL